MEGGGTERAEGARYSHKKRGSERERKCHKPSVCVLEACCFLGGSTAAATTAPRMHLDTWPPAGSPAGSLR